MYVYLSCYALIIACCIFEKKTDSPTKLKTTTLAFVIGTLALVVGLRDQSGDGGDYDWYAYNFDFLIYNKDFSWRDLFSLKDENGFYLYTRLIASFTDNKFIYFLITAVLSYALLFLHIRRFASYVFLALLFIFCRQFLQSTVYVRQFLAVNILWLAVPYVYERKLAKFLLVVLLAVSIHVSSIVFLPLYWLGSRRWSVASIISVAGASLAIGCSPLVSILFSFLGTSLGSEKSEMYLDEISSSGVHTFYLLEGILMLAALVASYKKINIDKRSNCLINITVAYICFMFLALQAPGLIRFIWCFWIGPICMLPIICDALESPRGLLSKLILVGYFSSAMALYAIRFSGGAFLEPYRTFLFQ